MRDQALKFLVVMLHASELRCSRGIVHIEPVNARVAVRQLQGSLVLLS